METGQRRNDIWQRGRYGVGGEKVPKINIQLPHVFETN